MREARILEAQAEKVKRKLRGQVISGSSLAAALKREWFGTLFAITVAMKRLAHAITVSEHSTIEKRVIILLSFGRQIVHYEIWRMTTEPTPHKKNHNT